MGKGKRKKSESAPSPLAAPRIPSRLFRTETLLRAVLALLVLAVILAMYPYTRDATAPIKYLMIAWGALIASGILLIDGVILKKPLKKPPVFFLVLTAFVAVNFVAALLSDHPGHAMVTWRRFAALYLVYLAAAQVYRKPRHISGLMLVVLVGVSISTLYAVIQYLGLDPFPWEDIKAPIYRELPGTFGNPNYAAHTMILCIVMAVSLAMRRKMRWAGVFAALLLIHMYFTGQRGGLVGLAMAGALLLVGHAVRKRVASPRRAALAALLVTALIIPAAIGVTMAATKARTGVAFPLERQLLLRYHAYDGATRMMLANPLLGYGPGNYQIENPFFWTLEEQEWFAVLRKMNQHVHNDVLEAGVEAGFPGAILYLLFLVIGIGQGLMLAFTAQNPDRRRLGYTFAALFCAFLVDGALGFNLRVPVSSLLIFLFAGALDGLYLESLVAGSTPARSRYALIVRPALVVLALLLVIYETFLFSAEKQLQFGRGAFLSDAYPRADKHYERAEELCPWQWMAPFERAKCALRMAQYYESKDQLQDGFDMRNKAAEHFAHSVERNPTYVLSLLGIAETNLSLGYSKTEFNQDTRDEYLEKAAQAAQKARNLCPLMPEGHDILGRVASLRAMEMQTAPNPQEADIEKAQDKWREAITHLERAIQLGSDKTASLYLMLVQAHIGLQDLDAAQNALKNALRTDPTNREILPILYRFGTQYDRYDFLTKALAQYIQRLKNEAPEEGEIIAQAALYLGATQFRIYKNPEEAEKSYITAVNAAPQRAETWAAFAQFSKMSNRPSAFQNAVIRALHDAQKTGIEPLPQLLTVVQVWEEGSEKLPEATGSLARALRTALDAGMNPGEARNQFGWAAEILLVETQKPGVSKADRAIALLNIGSILNGMDNLPLAATVLRAAIDVLPPKQAALAAREAAQVLARQNDEDQAFLMLQKAVTLDPDNPDTRMAFARALAKRGQKVQALDEYRRLLQIPGLSKEAQQVINNEMRALQ